jgi:DUF4097 and DUF4098 domain-containing protein YvlB
MKTNSNLKLVAIWVLLLAGLMAADARAADGEFDVRMTVDEAILLDVDTGSGSISVTASEGNEVTVHGEIRISRRWFGGRPSNADEIIQQLQDNPPVELSGGRLRVGYIEDRSIRRKVSISFDITVPSNTEVRADSGSGSITVTDISAPVSADTGSGSVTLENIDGPVKADTGSGSIRAEGISGSFSGDTGSGSIYLAQTGPGDVDISTGSGSSELTGVIGAVTANSGSGRIVVEGRQEGDWHLDTGSGSVRVTLPEDAAFNLQAETNSGGIDIDHPLMVEGKISKREITGTVRGGGYLLHIDTGSGGIRIR